LLLLGYIEIENVDTDNVRLNKVLDFIGSNIEKRISLSELANEVNLSESRFKNFFRELTGFTPGDYIQRKKVEFAIQKIKGTPQVSLTELAYSLDFPSPQYFCTVLKKYTGKSFGQLKLLSK